MTNCLRIEICRSYMKDRFHYREGDESGSIGMGNTTEEEIIREIKDQMRKLPPFSGKSAGAKDNETKTPIVFNNNTVSVESANPAPEKPRQSRTFGFGRYSGTVKQRRYGRCTVCKDEAKLYHNGDCERCNNIRRKATFQRTCKPKTKTEARK